MKLSHKFVKNIPEQTEEGVLYISTEYNSAIHKCCCGCGNEVVTPIGSKGWQLTFDGKSISLYPSIGNLNFPCRSHYWIKNSTVVWENNFTQVNNKSILFLKLKEIWLKFCSIFKNN